MTQQLQKDGQFNTENLFSLVYVTEINFPPSQKQNV